MELRDDGMCFACGPNNPIGLKLKFEFVDGRYVADFTPRREHQGYDNITHGGIVSTLLDEAMAKLAYSTGSLAVTAELNVRFRKPAMVGEKLKVSGWLVSERRRMIEGSAEIRNLAGELVADATGKMMKVDSASE